MRTLKSFVVFLLLLVSTYASATSVRGTALGADGKPLTSGTLEFQLSTLDANGARTDSCGAGGAPQVTNLGVMMDTKKVIHPVTGGAFIDSVIGNDQINCGAGAGVGVFWHVTAKKADGTTSWEKDYSITGATWNINTAVALNTLPPSPVPSYLLSGSVNVNQTITQAVGTSLTLSGTVIIPNLSGNITTASALAANPTDCSANQFAVAIAANGNLTCAQPALANLSDASTIALLNSPVFTTQIKTPIVLSGAADPADAGFVRAGNNEQICWESSPAGTDVCVSVDANEIFQFTNKGQFNLSAIGGSTTGKWAVGMVNPTLALVGAQTQLSPSAYWQGHAWHTVSAVDYCDEWYAIGTPAPGNPPTSALSFRWVNGTSCNGTPVEKFRINSDGTVVFVGSISGSITGNAATATALAADPADCASGQSAQGINASGVATGCAPRPVTKTVTTSQWLASYDSSTGAYTSSQPAFTDISGTIAASQLPGTINSMIVSGTSAVNATANGVTLSTLKRFTDSSPTGNFVVYQTAAAGTLWSVDITGTLTTGTIPVARLSGTVATATALAANPTDCSAGTFATTIDAQGNLTCAAVNLTNALQNIGTTTTVLHGNASGTATFGAVVLTTDVSGILPGANGGTNNGFMQFTGPATSLKTYALPNASDTIAVLGTSQTFTAIETMQRNSIASTLTDALYLQNSTASTSGVPVQISPNLRLGGQGWNTTSVANNWMDWIVAVVPVSGASPSSLLSFRSSLSTTSTPSYTQRMTISDSGVVTATTFVGALTGNASTATALAADPADCPANQFAQSINASGTLTCAALSLTGAQFANQGTPTTVLHGNTAGNPTFAGITTSDTSVKTGSGTNFVTDNAPTIAGTVAFSNQIQVGGATTSNAGYINIHEVDAGGLRGIVMDNTNTGSGCFAMQAGAGSATYGGGLLMCAGTHASLPGWVVVGLAGTSKFAVNTSGWGHSGTDVFTVDQAGAVVAASLSLSGAASVNSLTSTTAIGVASGGTGLGTLTAHFVPVGNGTGALTMVTPSTSGLCFMSNGTGADPSFQACPGSAATSLQLTQSVSQTVTEAAGTMLTLNKSSGVQGANYALRVIGTWTDSTAGTYISLYDAPTFAPTAAQASSWYGLRVEPLIDLDNAVGAQTGSFNGLTVWGGRLSNTSALIDVTSFIGVDAYGVQATTGGTAFGTFTTALGLRARCADFAGITMTAGTVTNCQALAIVQPTNLGSVVITNLTEASIAVPTVGTNNTAIGIGTTTTGNWGIYSNTTYASKFFGNIIVAPAALAAGTYHVQVMGASGAARDVLQAGVTSVSNGLTVQYNGTGMVYTMANGYFNISGNTTLPAATNTSLYMAGAFGSPILGKIYVGDGAGWELDFAKRTGSADTTLFKLKDNGDLVIGAGYLDAFSGIKLNGAAASGNLLRGDGTKFTTQADTRTVCYVAGSDSASAALATTDDQADYWLNDTPNTWRVTRVWAQSDAGTPTINIQRDDGTAANILTSDLTAATGNGACSDSSAGSMTIRGGSITCTNAISATERDIAQGQALSFLSQTPGGTAKRVTVCVQLTAQN